MMEQALRHIKKNLRRVACRGLLAVVGSAMLGAWTRPNLPVLPDSPTRLSYMIVAVNGEPHLVKAGAELAVLWGDSLQVQTAVLAGAKQHPAKIHVFGLKGRTLAGQGEQALTFTTQDLRARYSEQRRGEVYAVAASSSGQVHGGIFLHLLPPALSFAEVLINGHKVTLRDGEALRVRKQDQLQVERVVTNLKDNDGVLFKMATAQPGGKFSIQFIRGGKVFAQIPLTVAD